MEDKHAGDILATVREMISEVLGGDLLDEIDASSSFRDDLEFQSIEFVALAERVQDRYEEVDFVAWLQGMEIEQIYQLRVGDLQAFIAQQV